MGRGGREIVLEMEDLQRMFKKSARTIRRWRDDKGFPLYGGRRLRAIESEVIAWIKQQK